MAIKHLQNLEVLDLKKNKITSIPYEFGFLSKLLKLDLEENQIQVLNQQVGALTSLSDLNLSKNKIQAIENDGLCNLKNLVLLDLHQN